MMGSIRGRRKATVIRSVGNGVCEVDLTRGLAAIFDECDAENVRLFSWYSSTCGGSKTDYARGRLKGMCRRSGWPMYRVILCFPLLSVDHINGNGLDNRRCNLRLATQAQNCCNVGVKNMPKTSVYKGVYRYGSRWYASIRINRKLIHLGSYADEYVAASAYDIASHRLHGEFGYRNHSRVLATDIMRQRVNERISRKLESA